MSHLTPQPQRKLELDLVALKVLEDDASDTYDDFSTPDEQIVASAVHEVRHDVARRKLAAIEKKMQDFVASSQNPNIVQGVAAARLTRLYENILTFWKRPEYTRLPIAPIMRGYLDSASLICLQ